MLYIIIIIQGHQQVVLVNNVVFNFNTIVNIFINIAIIKTNKKNKK